MTTISLRMDDQMKKDKFSKEVQNKKYERQKNNCRGFYRRNKL